MDVYQDVVNASDRLFQRMLTQPQDLQAIGRGHYGSDFVSKFSVGSRESIVVWAIRRILCMLDWDLMKLPNFLFRVTYGRRPVPWKDNR